MVPYDTTVKVVLGVCFCGLVAVLIWSFSENLSYRQLVIDDLNATRPSDVLAETRLLHQEISLLTEQVKLLKDGSKKQDAAIAQMQEVLLQLSLVDQPD